MLDIHLPRKPFANGTAFLLFLTYSILVPVSIHWLTKGELGYFFFAIDDPWLRLCLTLLHLYVSLRLAGLSSAADVPWMRFPFYAFVYVWISAAPSVQFAEGLRPWGVYLTDNNYLYTLFVIFVGIIAYEGGNTLAKKTSRPPAVWLNSPSYRTQQLIVLTLFGVSTVVTVIAITGISGLLGSRGDAGNAFQELGSGNQARLVLGSLLRAPILVAVFSLLYLAFSGGWRKIPYFRVLLLVALVAFVVANFPTAVSRGWLGAILVGILSIYAFAKRRNVYRLLGLPMIGGFLFVYPLMVFRSSVSINPGRIMEPTVYADGDFDVLQLASIIVNYTDSFGLTWGRQLLGPLLFWVPRSAWPDKPVGTGAHVAENTGMSFTNVSAPLWAEGYINFGLLGTIVLLLLYGYFSRKWEMGLNSGTMNLRIAVVASFFSGFQVFALRGDLMTSATFSLPVLIIAVLFLKQRGAPQRDA